MSDGAAPRPDVSDLYAVHGVFRDTLGAAPRLIGEIAPGDAARVGVIANYYENVLSFLEAHHDGEDKVVFPLLRERCADQSALMDLFDEDHEEAIRLMEAAMASLGAWSSGDDSASSAVVRDLEALRLQLVEHLNREESEGLPLCAEHLSAEEWGALPGHGMAAFQGDKIWLILGLIAERMNDEQRAAMMEHLPPPAVEMWSGFGERAFSELSLEVVVEVDSRVT
jgi:hemerythrin-like domain-containing protein